MVHYTGLEYRKNLIENFVPSEWKKNSYIITYIFLIKNPKFLLIKNQMINYTSLRFIGVKTPRTSSS